MVRFLAFSFRRAWQGFWRNALMSLAATATMVLMLVLLAGLIIVLTGLDATMKYVEGKVAVAAYLKDTATEAEVGHMRLTLEAMPEVTKVTYISKEQALANFKQRQKEVADLADTLPSNPLPASFEINLRDTNDYVAVTDFLREQDIVDRVLDQKATVSQISTVTGFLRTGGLIILGVVGFTVLFIIVNTIRLAVVARSEEIEIMRLVGASDAFIRWPFIFEGAMVGLLGAAITLGFILLGEPHLANFMSGFFPDFSRSASAAMVRTLSFLVLGTGVGIGVLGSYLSVRSYLIR